MHVLSLCARAADATMTLSVSVSRVASTNFNFISQILPQKKRELAELLTKTENRP